MVAPGAACPTDETLAAFAHRKLAPVEQEGVAGHLDDCESCRLAVRIGAKGTPPESLETTLPAATGPVTIGGQLGRYRIKRLLGAGGMGQVYAALDTELDREVALKVLRPELGGAAVLEERLVRESRMTAKVAHPSVMTVYDVGRVGEVVFIAMELIRGETLGVHAQPLPWRKIVGLYVQAADGLAAAHDAGIVHRDFKPENVLVAGARVIITDFGIARAIEGVSDEPSGGVARDVKLTATGLAIGTPAYMAPEQLLGERVGPSADVFAFSVSLWEAVFGARPFPGRSIMEIQGAMQSPPRAANPVSRALQRVLARGLAIEPADRPTLKQLARDLIRVQRRRKTTAIAAGALGLVGAGVVGALVLGGQSVTEHPCAGPIENFHYDHDGLARVLGPGPLLTKLDNVAAHWRVVHAETCHAQYSPPQAPDTAACLDARKLELEGTVADIVADGPGHAAALSAVISLADVCTRPPSAALFSRVPANPAIRRQVSALRYRAFDAEKIRNDGNPAKAIELANQLVIDSKGVWAPVEAEILYLLGSTQSLGTDPKAGFETLRQAATLAEASHHTYIAISAWTQLITSSTFDFGEPQRGLEYMGYAEAALKRSEWPPEATAVFMYAKGGTLVELNRWSEAEDAFRKGLALDEQYHLPYTAMSIQGLGYLYEQQGRYADAVTEYRKAIALLTDDPADLGNRITFYQRLSLNLSLLGQTEEALKLAREMVVLADASIDPKSADLVEVHLGLVDALENAGQLPEALALAQQAIKDLQATGDSRSEKMGEALLVHAEVLEAMDRHAEAERDFERSCDIIAFRAGEDSSQEATCRLHQISALEGLGKTREMDAMLTKIIPILEKTHGENHPDTISAKATLAAHHEDIAGLEAALARLANVAVDPGVAAVIKKQLALVVYPTDPRRGEALLREAITDFGTSSGLWKDDLAEAKRELARHHGTL